MRTGVANHLKTVGGCLKDLDHLCIYIWEYTYGSQNALVSGNMDDFCPYVLIITLGNGLLYHFQNWPAYSNLSHIANHA